MKKEILTYQRQIAEVLEHPAQDEDWEALCQDYLVKIGFFQHERLIHLIVTVTFAILEVIAVAASMLSENMGLMILSVLILVLLIPYIRHYYFLENEVQKMYKIYDEIKRRAGEKGV